MDKAKRKEVEISKDSFSYMHVEGKKHDKNIFFFHATGFNAETYIPVSYTHLTLPTTLSV